MLNEKLRYEGRYLGLFSLDLQPEKLYNAVNKKLPGRRPK
jgi:hypothetical protein